MSSRGKLALSIAAGCARHFYEPSVSLPRLSGAMPAPRLVAYRRILQGTPQRLKGSVGLIPTRATRFGGLFHPGSPIFGKSSNGRTPTFEVGRRRFDPYLSNPF